MTNASGGLTRHVTFMNMWYELAWLWPAKHLHLKFNMAICHCFEMFMSGSSFAICSMKVDLIFHIHPPYQPLKLWFSCSITNSHCNLNIRLLNVCGNKAKWWLKTKWSCCHWVVACQSWRCIGYQSIATSWNETICIWTEPLWCEG